MKDADRKSRRWFQNRAILRNLHSKRRSINLCNFQANAELPTSSLLTVTRTKVNRQKIHKSSNRGEYSIIQGFLPQSFGGAQSSTTISEPASTSWSIPSHGAYSTGYWMNDRINWKYRTRSFTADTAPILASSTKKAPKWFQNQQELNH